MRGLPAAFFLACSWFWCIGGFFPVLLEREFGAVALPFFIVFNVAGATLFGLVWTGAGRQSFLARHRLPAEAFSLLIAGYHLVFMAWISTLLGSPVPLIGFVAAAAAFTVLRRQLTELAPAVFGITLILFSVILTTGEPAPAPAAALQPFAHQILPLALGFLLAPYFDLTFHRAFAESPRPRVSFLLGFGVLFLALLGGMYLAAPFFAPLLTSASFSGTAVYAIVSLLVLQTGFTTAAHLRELAGSRWADRRLAAPIAGSVVVLAVLHPLAGLAVPEIAQMAGELVYRGFVFLIGVLFPVILLFGGLNRRALTAMAFLTPCYTLGFLIGGDFSPFLSVAMAGLAVLYWLRPRLAATQPN
ncbi:MAG: hypothetical protein ACMVY4_09375 [Minwuia sp.]|uniref:hypothetical protein n=1 Tax=Minwuia sp. TaxID=2493630 RepID=UPI003A8592B5